MIVEGRDVWKAVFAAMLAVLATSASAETASFSFPVPVVTLRAGDLLVDELVTERTLFANAQALRTHYTSRTAVVGKVAKHVLPAGSAIPVNAVREPYAFKEGERVEISFTSGDLAIRGLGIALQPGAVGQTVKLRNPETGIVVTGVVQPDGSVSVGGG
jgi:flagella basal body P-ring formation protein FlgA